MNFICKGDLLVKVSSTQAVLNIRNYTIATLCKFYVNYVNSNLPLKACIFTCTEYLHSFVSK